MAKQTSVNTTPATGAVAIFDLVAFLVTLGWEVLEESDGTTYEADVPTNGRQITSGSAGAGGFANTNAWMRVREPGGTGGREWVFQRGTTNLLYRVKVSALDGFVGGTPGAAQVPSATDEAILIGAGTDASPTFGTLFDADGTYRWHLVGFDVQETTVYPWYAFASTTGTGFPRTLIVQDSLDPGSFPALVGTRTAPTSGEPDPAIYGCGHDASSPSNVFTFGNGSPGQWGDRGAPYPQGWYAMNGSNGQTEAFVGMTGFGVVGDLAQGDVGAPADAGSADGFGPNPLDDSDPIFPVLYGRQAGASTQVGTKGYSAHLRFKGVDRDYPDTVDLGSERFVYAGDLLIPFENGATPLT